MPLTSDIILNRLAKDGYSLSEAGWIHPSDRKSYFEVTAGKDGHRHIACAPDRETAVAELGSLMGYPLEG